MKRVGMTWRVHPEHIEPYTDIHLNPWPELLAAIQAVGINSTDYLSLSGSSHLEVLVNLDSYLSLEKTSRETPPATSGKPAE